LDAIDVVVRVLQLKKERLGIVISVDMMSVTTVAQRKNPKNSQV
jgi:hypothetical protein